MANLLIDLVNEAEVYTAIQPAAYTVTTQGAAIDMANGQCALNAIVNLGTTVGTVSTVVVQIEECSTTNGTFTLIPGMVCTVTQTNQNRVLRGLQTSRYVRANMATLTGTTTITQNVCVDIIAQRRFGASSTLVQSGYSNSPTNPTY